MHVLLNAVAEDGARNWLVWLPVVSTGIALVALGLTNANRKTAKRALALAEGQEQRRKARLDLSQEEAVWWRPITGGHRVIGIRVLAVNPTDRDGTLLRADLHVTYTSKTGSVMTVKIPHNESVDGPSGISPMRIPKHLPANGAEKGWLLFKIDDDLIRGDIERYDAVVDTSVVDRLLVRLELVDDEVVVDAGAGRGALTLPLARAGARVLAIERDRRFVADLQARLERHGLAHRVQIRRGDLRETPLPRGEYRVVANPPFGLTTALLRRLFDDPARGPVRADLLLQWEVARKHARAPAVSLQSAGWAPWWRFELGEKVPRSCFRPIPSVHAGWLIAVRRDPPLLPWTLADGFVDVLRPVWQEATQTRSASNPAPRRSGRRG